MTAAALQVDVTCMAEGWPAEAAGLAERAARLVWETPESGGGGPAELSLVLAGDGTVRELNRDWRGRDAPTNVLSFPADQPGLPPETPRPLGDVVLALETIRREAEQQGKPFADHLGHLVVHGVLHLLGFDHNETAEAEKMESLETRLLARLGIADPYAPRPGAGENG